MTSEQVLENCKSNNRLKWEEKSLNQSLYQRKLLKNFVKNQLELLKKCKDNLQKNKESSTQITRKYKDKSLKTIITKKLTLHQKLIC